MLYHNTIQHEDSEDFQAFIIISNRKTVIIIWLWLDRQLYKQLYVLCSCLPNQNTALSQK